MNTLSTTTHRRSPRFRVPESGFLALLFLLIIPGFLGASSIRLSLDRDDGRYQEGETATVQIVAAPEILEERTWNGTVSWQQNWEGESTESNWSPNEPLHLELTGEQPGQVIVTATLRAEEDPAIHHVERIGFLYRPDAIELSTPEPEDFDAFWNLQKKNWREIPQEIELRPVDSPRDDIRFWNLTIHLEGETPVSGYLALPRGAEPGTLPAILQLHGAGFRSSSLPSVTRWAERGFIALDINAHGLPNGKSADFYIKQGQTELAGYRQRGVESRETWYFRTMYLRILTAIDYVCSFPEWNGKDFALHGSSQGGGQALAGAGLDSRVSVLAASVPALVDLVGEPSARKAGWPQPVGFAGDDSAHRTQIQETIAYFDGGLFARRIEAPLVVSLGLADPVCPAVGIQATVNNLAGPVEAIYRPKMTHAYPADLRDQFEAFILDRVTLPPSAPGQ